MERTAVILGGGVTGLTTGWKLSQGGMRVLVFERSHKLGGLAGTVSWNGATLDLGPHKFYTLNDEVRNDLTNLLPGDSLLTVKKISRIHLLGKTYQYPLSTMELVLKLPPMKVASMILGYGAAVLGLGAGEPEGTYESYLVRRFGRQLYRLVFADYASKIWGDPLKLDEELASSRVAVPNLLTMVRNMIFGEPDDTPTHADSFLYPKEGCQAFINALAGAIARNGGSVRTGIEPTSILSDGKRISGIRLSDGETITLHGGDVLLSTIPLESLASLMIPNLPDGVMELASRLTYRSLNVYYLPVAADKAMPDQWVFFPEVRFLFTRVSEQKSFSNYTVPRGMTVLAAEEPHAGSDGNEDRGREVRSQILGSGIIRRELEVGETMMVSCDHAYPVYFKDFRKTVNELLRRLDGIENLFSIGRQGAYSYIGMCDCMEVANRCSGIVLEDRGKTDRWHTFREETQRFVVVD